MSIFSSPEAKKKSNRGTEAVSFESLRAYKILSFIHVCYNRMMKENKFLEVALAAVKKAEPVFLKSFGRASGIKVKHGAIESLVTAADEEIERLLVQEISAQFPHHAIVGEEGTSRQGSEYTWYIDPIDGTTNYVHGIHHCSISVALWDAQGPLIAVVHDPIHVWTYTAIRGGGAFKNGQAIHVSTTDPLKEGVGALGWKAKDSVARNDLCTKIENNAYRFRVFSGSVLELCFVASGILDFYVTVHANIWDLAAGILVLTEAGGTVTEKSGVPFIASSTNLLGTNTKLHSELLSVLK